MDSDYFEEELSGKNKALTRKHLAERQRRARINSYLEEIQELVTPKDGNNSSTKVEKAEVLEQAVTYMKQHQRIRQDKSNNNSPCERPAPGSDVYKKGFETCMTSILGQLTDVEDIKDDLEGIKNHLGNFLQNVVTGSEERHKILEMSSSAQDLTNSVALPGDNCQSEASIQMDVNGSDVMKNHEHVKQQQTVNAMTSEWVNNQANFVQQLQQQQQHHLHQQQQHHQQQQQQQQQQYMAQQQYIQQMYQQAFNGKTSRDPSYNVFHGLQSVYANYLQDERACSKGNELKPLMSNAASPNYMSVGIQDLSIKNNPQSNQGMARTVWRPW